jgi:molybdopterin-containing oxidoreductase family membrane subunit
MTFAGTLGLFLFLFLLFVRLLPMIPISEMRTMLPAARIRPKTSQQIPHETAEEAGD